MNVIACIKQVPATTSVEINPETGTLIRDGSKAKINPFDLFVLETAVRLKEQYGAHITALTMGPPQAKKILEEAYMLDVDETVLVSDRNFGGADVLATAYTLSQAIRSQGKVDLIICGKQTTDGDTAQVGPAIAEMLGIPHAAWVSKLVSADENGIKVYQELDEENTAVLDLPFPCLITTEKDIVEVRLPSYKTMLKNQDKTIQEVCLKDMEDTDANNYGLKGSATQVERIFPPEPKEGHVVLDGTDEKVGDKLADLLREAHIL